MIPLPMKLQRQARMYLQQAVPAGNLASVRFTVNENHTWNDGVVQKEATTTAVGEKLYTCTVCGATKTEEIPMVNDTEETTQGRQETTTPEATTQAQATTTPEVTTQAQTTTTNTKYSTKHSAKYSTKYGTKYGTVISCIRSQHNTSNANHTVWSNQPDSWY